MRIEIDLTQELTKEQLKMLEKAGKMPIPEDAEYPELTEEELKQFRRISPKKAG